MNRIEISINRLDSVIKHHKSYDFPEFIRTLRSALGISRRTMSEDLAIQYLKLYYIETGNGAVRLNEELLSKIANYFGVPEEILRAKANSYFYYPIKVTNE